MNFKVLDEYGKVVLCNVLGTFSHDDKNFIVYTDGTKINNKEEVYASLYTMDKDNNLKLLPIFEEKDWDLVDEFLKEL